MPTIGRKHLQECKHTSRPLKPVKTDSKDKKVYSKQKTLKKEIISLNKKKNNKNKSRHLTNIKKCVIFFVRNWEALTNIQRGVG